MERARALATGLGGRDEGTRRPIRHVAFTLNGRRTATRRRYDFGDFIG